MKTLYLALGRHRIRQDRHGYYPSVIINRLQFSLNIGENMIWRSINGRPLDMERIQTQYEQRALEGNVAGRPPIPSLVADMEKRGLIASGTGETEIDALLNLFCALCPYRSPLTMAGILTSVRFPYILTESQKRILQTIRTRRPGVAQILGSRRDVPFDALSDAQQDVFLDLVGLYLNNKIVLEV